MPIHLPELQFLAEDRQKDWKYTEKRVKNALSKVTLELEGNDSGAMSRLMTRYKRLDRQWKLMEERRNEVNKQVKEVADRIFDAEDALATRVIETVSYTVMLTKSTPASEKEPTKKTDYESAFSELSRLVPELEAKAKEILEKYSELVPAKDTPSALKYTPKLEEGAMDVVKGWVSKAKSFVKGMLTWGREYDAKLDAFRRKYKLKGQIMNVKLREEKDEHEGWYIVRVKDDAPSSGPYGSRQEASRQTKYMHWYKVGEYDIAYGTIDDEDKFKDLEIPK